MKRSGIFQHSDSEDDYVQKNPNDPGAKLKKMLQHTDSDSSEMGRMDDMEPHDMLQNLGSEVHANNISVEMFKGGDASLLNFSRMSNSKLNISRISMSSDNAMFKSAIMDNTVMQKGMGRADDSVSSDSDDGMLMGGLGKRKK